MYLIETADHPGGTLARCLIHTLGGLYDSEGEYLNPGLPVELAERLMAADPRAVRRRIGRAWVLNITPEIYQAVVAEWIAETPGIEFLPRARVVEVQVADGAITELRLALGGTSPRELRLSPLAVIDATGSAELVRATDTGLVSSGPRHAAAGLIFRYAGAEAGALRFPRSVDILQQLRRAARDGALSAECGMTWIDTGMVEGEAYVKLSVPLPGSWAEPANRYAAEALARRLFGEVSAFLRSLPAFADATLSGIGELGIREGGSMVGEYRLSEDDVRSGRKFSDAAARCCWPIEYWDPASGVSLHYLAPGDYYEIPLRALKAQAIRNLWAAGKCLSAEPLAQASARIAGCCWAMGEAVGQAVSSRPPTN